MLSTELTSPIDESAKAELFRPSRSFSVAGSKVMSSPPPWKSVPKGASKNSPLIGSRLETATASARLP